MTTATISPAIAPIAAPGFWPQAVAAGATVIRVTRDYDFYYYSRAQNGRTDVLAQAISAARAREIVDSNPHGRVIGTSPVAWQPGAYQWTFVVEVTE